MKNPIKVLSIDGGGIRGIIPATVLARIEELTRKPIAALFDLIAGTSTGGILALGLTKPGPSGVPDYSALELADLYKAEGSRIFSRSWWYRMFALNNLIEKKYPSSGMDQVLQEYFGQSRLKDALTDVLIPSYEIGQGFPFFFRSSLARTRPDYDFPMRDVARATSAAPTYFEPLQLSSGTAGLNYTLIDGGVYANNPAACALVEARTSYPAAESFLVVSLGTGNMTRTIAYDEAKNWGVARWAKPVLDVVFDGVSSTVDYQLRQLLPPSRYYRLQPALDSHDSSMDDASAANLSALETVASNLLETHSSDIESICEALESSVAVSPSISLTPTPIRSREH